MSADTPRTVGTWRCRLGFHVWRHTGPLMRGTFTRCLRCGARRVGTGW